MARAIRALESCLRECARPSAFMQSRARESNAMQQRVHRSGARHWDALDITHLSWTSCKRRAAHAFGTELVAVPHLRHANVAPRCCCFGGLFKSHAASLLFACQEARCPGLRIARMPNGGADAHTLCEYMFYLWMRSVRYWRRRRQAKLACVAAGLEKVDGLRPTGVLEKVVVYVAGDSLPGPPNPRYYPLQ